MKCMIINGSPRKGNTWALVETAKKELDKLAEMTYEEVHLGKIDLPMCKGCFNCFFEGEKKCPNAEKVQDIAAKILECDILIVASPTYSLAVSALLKNFIDHMSYNFHRPQMHSKRAIVLSTTVGGGAKQTAMYIRDVLKHWGVNRVYTVSVACYTDKGYIPTENVVKKINKLSLQIYKDVSENRKYKPTWKRAIYHNVWRAMSQLSPYEKSADNRFWKDSGMLDKSYVEGIKISLPKRLVGNFLYKMVIKKYKTEKVENSIEE